jgi:hypothetical protein
MKRSRLRRISHLTLLETLVALSILSIVLVFVFGYFRDLSEINRMADESQKESFQMRYLESRLSFIFERVVNENSSARTFFFYAEPPHHDRSRSTSLILTFNNEVRLDPAFSGDVLGRIYLDQDHTLRLGIWPLHVEEPSEYFQDEILMENVADVHFSFYAAPERVQDSKEVHSGENIDPEKKSPQKDHWHEDEWEASYEQMPSILKIRVDLAKDPKDLEGRHRHRTSETEPLTFYFVLPSSKNPVQYPPFGDIGGESA